MQYKRVLLKLSGEALQGNGQYGIDSLFMNNLAEQIHALYQQDIQIAIVIGGGNFFRGAKSEKTGLDRVVGDQMGMLATVMNGLAFSHILKHHHLPVKLMSSLSMPAICDMYTIHKARKALDRKKILILTAGSGHPFFTTDMPAALRAAELKCDLLLKATKIDGVYDKDPAYYADALKYTRLTFQEAIDKKLKIMDLSAFTLAQENNIPIIVFSILQKDGLIGIFNDQSSYTLISD